MKFFSSSHKKLQNKRSHTIRNICIAIGIVLIRNWIGDLFDQFLFPHHPVLSEILSISLGIMVLYLAWWDAYYLGGYNEEEEEAEEKNHIRRESILFGGVVFLLLIILILVLDTNYLHRL